jgi:hypothetical protein
VGERGFPEILGGACYPIYCLYLQLNFALGVKQEHFPSTDWRQPQLVLFILKLLLDATDETFRFLHHP